MAKIVCEKCGTEYKFEVAKDLKNCPICGASMMEDDFSHEESLGFIDKEDFKNPDLYFYDIDEPEEYGDDLRDVWCQCTLCKEVNTISYNKFDNITSEYLKLKKDLQLTCKGCGKQIDNRIVPKRPDGWRDLNHWEKSNTPKCPVCNSTKIHKISMTNKAASALAFGIFAAGHVSKTYKCDICGSKF